MDMSSYQFVNTIAQCYAEQAGQAAGAAASAQASAQDYYNMNYPNCYSPNLNNHATNSYNQYSLMMSGQAAAAAMATAVNDYNSLAAGGGGTAATATPGAPGGVNNQVCPLTQFFSVYFL